MVYIFVPMTYDRVFVDYSDVSIVYGGVQAVYLDVPMT